MRSIFLLAVCFVAIPASQPLSAEAPALLGTPNRPAFEEAKPFECPLLKKRPELNKDQFSAYVAPIFLLLQDKTLCPSWAEKMRASLMRFAGQLEEFNRLSLDPLPTNPGEEVRKLVDEMAKTVTIVFMEADRMRRGGLCNGKQLEPAMKNVLLQLNRSMLATSDTLRKVAQGAQSVVDMARSLKEAIEATRKAVQEQYDFWDRRDLRRACEFLKKEHAKRCRLPGFRGDDWSGDRLEGLIKDDAHWRDDFKELDRVVALVRDPQEESRKKVDATVFAKKGMVATAILDVNSSSKNLLFPVISKELRKTERHYYHPGVVENSFYDDVDDYLKWCGMGQAVFTYVSDKEREAFQKKCAPLLCPEVGLLVSPDEYKEHPSNDTAAFCSFVNDFQYMRDRYILGMKERVSVGAMTTGKDASFCPIEGSVRRTPRVEDETRAHSALPGRAVEHEAKKVPSPFRWK